MGRGKRLLIAGATLGILGLTGAGVAFIVLAIYSGSKTATTTKTPPTHAPANVPTNVPAPTTPPAQSKPLPPVAITTPNGSQVSQRTGVVGTVPANTNNPVTYTWLIQTSGHVWQVSGTATSPTLHLGLAPYAEKCLAYKENGYIPFTVTLRTVHNGISTEIRKTFVFVNDTFKLVITPHCGPTTLGSVV